MPHKLLQVLANTLAIIEISFMSLIGYSNTHYLVAFWEISIISPFIFGSLVIKAVAIVENFVICILHIVSYV